MEEPEGLRPLSDSQLEALETAVASYQASLNRDGGAARYLLSRGLGREEAATYRLGVVGDPEPGHGHVRGFLAIPYLDPDGRPVSMRFRCIQEHDHRANHHGKYMSLTDEPSRLYGIESIIEAVDEIHVTEGELDRLILKKIGLHAIGVPGIDAWMPHHRRMLAGFSRVWVWGDPDDAGAKFVGTLTRQLRFARGVKLRLGDVTETYKEVGAEGLLELVGR